MEVASNTRCREPLVESSVFDYVDKKGRPHFLKTFSIETNKLSDECYHWLRTVTIDFLLTLNSQTLLDRFDRLLPASGSLEPIADKYFLPRQVTEVVMYDELNPIFNLPQYNHNLDQPETLETDDPTDPTGSYYLEPYIIPNAMLTIVGVDKRPIYPPDKVCEIALTVHQISQDRQGLGRHLAEDAVRIAKEAGYKYVVVNFKNAQTISSKLFADMPQLVLVASSSDCTERYYRIDGIETDEAFEAALIAEANKIHTAQDTAPDPDPRTKLRRILGTILSPIRP